MRFMLRVEPADVTADYAVLTLHGPGRRAGPGGRRGGRRDALVSGWT